MIDNFVNAFVYSQLSETEGLANIHKEKLKGYIESRAQEILSR